MILLDTDHVSVLRMTEGKRRTHLVARLALIVNDVIGIPVVVAEETMRG